MTWLLHQPKITVCDVKKTGHLIVAISVVNNNNNNNNNNNFNNINNNDNNNSNYNNDNNNNNNNNNSHIMGRGILFSLGWQPF